MLHKKSCWNNNLTYSGFYSTNCAQNDWLYLSNSSRYWTINPANSAYNIINAVYIYHYGYLGMNTMNDKILVFPVVYLNSSVRITGGTGTGSDPYTLEL